MSQKSIIHKSIMKEYDYIKLRNNEKLLKNKKFVYEKIPRIEEIDDFLATVGFNITKSVLNNPKNAVSALNELHLKTNELKKEKSYLLEEFGFLEDFLDPIYNCELCKDEGYISDGISENKCKCYSQKFIDVAYKQYSIKKNLDSENFDYFNFNYYSSDLWEDEKKSPLENIKTIFEVSQKFVLEFETSPFNMILYGGTGLGKTFLCNCIAKDIIEKQKTVLYVTARDIFKIVEDLRFNKEKIIPNADYIDDIESVDLFIIDDLGSEFSNVVATTELFNIIDTRIKNKKATIISTNLTIENLGEVYSDRILSRIVGHYMLLRFFGDDIRLKKKKSGNV